MLKWYLITAPSEESSRNILKSLREQHLLVRKQDGKLYSCVSNQHQNWLEKVCQDFNATTKILENAPERISTPSKEEYLTRCGIKFFDPVQYTNHFRNCSKCNPKVKERKDILVVAKLSPGEPFDLNGVINSLENVREECLEWSSKLDSLVTNLKGYRDGKEKLTTLKGEVDKRINAVRLLLSDGKI